MPPSRRTLGSPGLLAFNDPAALMTSLVSISQPAFPQFCKLPPELRVRIWEFSLHDVSRLVSIHCGADMPLIEPVPRGLAAGRRHVSSELSTSASSSPTRTSANNVCTSSASIPSQLHTCLESRAVALSFYPRTFSYCGMEPKIFFNSDNDILYFGPRSGYRAAYSQLQSFLLTVSPNQLAAVRRIALDGAIFANDTITEPISRQTHTIFHNTAIISSQVIRSITEAINDMRRRMPYLEEIIFVPQGGVQPQGTSLAEVKLAFQTQAQLALNDIARQAGNAWIQDGPRYTISEYPVTPSMLAWSTIANLPRQTIYITGDVSTIPDMFMNGLAALRPQDHPDSMWDWLAQEFPGELLNLEPQCWGLELAQGPAMDSLAIDVHDGGEAMHWSDGTFSATLHNGGYGEGGYPMWG